MKAVRRKTVTVSQGTVFWAEALITNCSACSASPGVPFAKILEKVGGYVPLKPFDMLAVPGRCPYCKSKLDHNSIVVPRT